MVNGQFLKYLKDGKPLSNESTPRLILTIIKSLRKNTSNIPRGGNYELYPYSYNHYECPKKTTIDSHVFRL